MKLSIAFLWAAAVAYCSADAPNLPDLSSYPQTEAFKGLTEWTADGGHEGPKVNILAITAFFGRSGTAYICSVSEKGNENDTCDVWNLACEDSRFKQLSPTQLADLKRAIGELPGMNVYPPVGNLLVVGFRDGTNWTVRSFDNRDLSPAMRKIYDILGGPFKTIQQRVGHT